MYTSDTFGLNVLPFLTTYATGLKVKAGKSKLANQNQKCPNFYFILTLLYLYQDNVSPRPFSASVIASSASALDTGDDELKSPTIK